jgi:hypothetical protein
LSVDRKRKRHQAQASDVRAMQQSMAHWVKHKKQQAVDSDLEEINDPEQDSDLEKDTDL